ncbi:signal recognition particle 14 kDa protein [Drosophila grimshawi]|uniref:Signal recognition particle 14 kDa protein n=1 Tax=Drosophila grimshawi TaxID=7222 RepID=B4JUB0_DROGR|nr:signal recognition particle 14 kDa protein [Drosophila grimshawi]EDV91080.1 GH17169 [Drosophila grimshawi]
MVLLDNSNFILLLEKIANEAKKDASFTITFKRYDGNDKPVPRAGRKPLPKPKTNMCLMRAKCKSKKISTVVSQENVPTMMAMYSQFMKSKMDGLKRVKKVKSKAKATKA